MNTFGKTFRVSIFGESHGECAGVTMDGVPAGIPLTENDFQKDLERRRPCGKGGTARVEEDAAHIVSGVYNGVTTGAPLTVTFANRNVSDRDYGQFVDIPRPGHADFSAGEKFGMWNDPRGGGQFSGRMTVAVVAAGVVAGKILQTTDGLEDTIDVHARVTEIGGLRDASLWDNELEKAAKEGDSLGGIVSCEAKVPAGLGDPFWDSVESVISHAVFSIPGVRGIEFGDGFAASAMRGSQHNDPFGPDGLPAKNGSGGVNGGITNGAPIKFRVAFKPTSSIAREQKTLNFETGQMTTLHCGGRHDVCFALRTPVIVEAMTKIVLVNLLD